VHDSHGRARRCASRCWRRSSPGRWPRPVPGSRPRHRTPASTTRDSAAAGWRRSSPPSASDAATLLSSSPVRTIRSPSSRTPPPLRRADPSAGAGGPACLRDLRLPGGAPMNRPGLQYITPQLPPAPHPHQLYGRRSSEFVTCAYAEGERSIETSRSCGSPSSRGWTRRVRGVRRCGRAVPGATPTHAKCKWPRNACWSWTTTLLSGISA
jgi:hypothetical protein